MKKNERAIEDHLSKKHNDQSKDITRNRQDAFIQIERTTHWMPLHKRGREVSRYKHTLRACNNPPFLDCDPPVFIPVWVS